MKKTRRVQRKKYYTLLLLMMKKEQTIRLAIFTFLFTIVTHLAFAQKRIKPIKLASGIFIKMNNLKVKVNNIANFRQWCIQYLPQSKVKVLQPKRGIVRISNVTKASITQLTSCPEVLFVDRGTHKPTTELSFDSRGFWVHKISTVHHLYSQLNGDGLFVSVREDPFDKTDIDFAGRIVDTTAVGKTVDVHASVMTSIIAGGGNRSSNSLGVAWKAQLYSSSFGNGLSPDDGNVLMNQKSYVQNHSYGVGAIENYYGVEAEAYDQQGVDFPKLLHVYSIGNFGNQADISNDAKYKGIAGFANISGQFKVAKNVLTVGEIDTNSVTTVFSSSGPAYDGRVKPELVAYGGGGSSESAAVVSGVSLLVQQAYQNKHGDIPVAALVKAILINSADDLGRAEVDFEYGYGGVDALGAIRTVEEGRHFGENLAASEDSKTLKITVPANAKHLKVTLVWNDPPASAGNTKALINDLDLTVTKTSSGTAWKPWVLNSSAHIDSLQLLAKRGEDRLNNIEQVTLSFPEAGEYEISVKAFALGVTNQNFQVVYEYPTGFDWVFPLKGDVLRSSRTRRLQWNWNQAAEGGKLEYKPVGSNTWQLIANIDDLSKEFHHWLVPDVFTKIQIRLTANSGFTFTSDPVQVMNLFSPEVGYDCENDLMLFWSPLAGVSSYQVYKMGAQYLEPLAIVQDTLLVVDKSANLGRDFAVAPIIDNETVRLGNSINVDFKGVGCYFKSFLSSIGFNDTTQLNLELATDYRLANIALQRSNTSGSGFDAIATVPINGNTYVFNDASPVAYRNVYRVELTNVGGRKFYSNEVEVLVVAKDELFMYPNPTKPNEPILVTDRRDAIVKVRVLSLAGKVLQAYVPNGIEQKEIFTDGLTTGVYLVELMLKDGSRATKRLVIK